LPPFPADKRASVIIREFLADETYARSSDITEYQLEINHLLIGPPPAGGMSWVTYRLSTGAETPSELELVAYSAQGPGTGELWIAVADFDQGSWVMNGPFVDGETDPIVPLAASNVSPLGNVFVALIVSAPDTQYIIARGGLTTPGDDALPIPDIQATPNPMINGRDT
jgi:hypothetical protein